MKKLLLILQFTCASTFFLVAQPSIQWQKSLGGSTYDLATSIRQTTDGGYIVAGASHSNDSDVTGNHGSDDYWIVKLNSTGVIQWQKSFGGTGNDVANSIRQTTDGGYVVAGGTTSNDSDVTGNHGSSDYWIVKLNSTGTVQWQKNLGGTDYDIASSIQQTTDDGYIVTGLSYSNDSDVTGNHGGTDYWVVKLDSTGIIEWQKSLGGTMNEESYSIQQTTDGGYFVAGYAYSNDGDVTGNHGSYDWWMVKLNSTGVVQWQKCLGGTLGELASSMQQTADGGYIVAGYSESNDGDVTGNHGSDDYWIVKLDSIGTIQWQKSLGGTGSDYSSSIQQTTDGGYIIAGASASNDGDVAGNHGDTDYWVVKLNSAGTIEWQKCLGGTLYEEALSIQQSTDGGYIVAGFANSNDSDLTVNYGAHDYWIVKLTPVFSGTREINSPVADLQIIPNPVSQSTVISFSIFQSENISVKMYDITGRFIKNLFNGNLNPGNHEIKLNVAEDRAIEDGVYILNFSGNSFSQSFKLVVVE